MQNKCVEGKKVKTARNNQFCRDTNKPLRHYCRDTNNKNDDGIYSHTNTCRSVEQ